MSRMPCCVPGRRVALSDPFPNLFILLMLQFGGISRTLLRLSRVVVPVLLVCACASAADASPHAGRRTVRTASRIYKDHLSRRAARLRQILRFGQTRNLCSTQLTLRMLERQNAQQAGPVAARSARVVGLALTPTRLKRDASDDVDDSDAAIQNDAPAKHIDCNEDVTPTLRSLGVLVSSSHKLQALDAFSPRSPRGPPLFV
jgi:hypothetical protein